MAKKAEAWAEYQDAAKVEMILKMLPVLAAKVAGQQVCLETIGIFSLPDTSVAAVMRVLLNTWA
jgi:hypothetical protein